MWKTQESFELRGKFHGDSLSKEVGCWFCLLWFRGRNDTCFGTVELGLEKYPQKHVRQGWNFTLDRKLLDWHSLSMINMEIIGSWTCNCKNTFHLHIWEGKKKKRPRTEPSRIPRERGASKNCDKARRRTKNQPRISTDSEVIKKN